MVTAMEVRKQKQEAAQRKQELELKYKDHIKKSYANRMLDEDSVFNGNQQELAELEEQEKEMVQKLNETRMSAQTA